MAAHIRHSEYIPHYSPYEVIEEGLNIAHLPLQGVGGFYLSAMKADGTETDRFTSDARLVAGLKVPLIERYLEMPGKVTELNSGLHGGHIKAEGYAPALGSAGLELSFTEDEDAGGTDIECLVTLEPAPVIKLISPIINLYIARFALPEYASAYRQNVEVALRNNSA